MLKKREDVFIEALKQIMDGIQEEAVKSRELRPDCGLRLVNNGSETKRINSFRVFEEIHG